MTKKINTNFDYNEKVKKCKAIDNSMSKNGLIQRLVKDVLENILEGEMEYLYGINVSPSMLSRITDKVLASATEWQNRMLDSIYPIVYLDAMYF